MSCYQYTTRLPAALCLVLFLGFTAVFPAHADPTRNRIGNTASVVANVDILYNICLQHCVQSSEYRMALESCEHTCAELRRTFTLRDKGYSTFEGCAKAVDNFDLNRDVLEKRSADWCAETWTHIHKRQGCREGTAAFYAAVTQENVCMRQPSGYTIAREPASPAQRLGPPAVVETPLMPVGAQGYTGPVTVPPVALSQGQPVSAVPVVVQPSAYPQSQAVATDTMVVYPTGQAGSYTSSHMGGYPDQAADVATDTTVVLPAGQANGGAGAQYPASAGTLAGTPGSDPVFVFGPTLVDTPKYQPPGETARTQRRSGGGSAKPAAPAQRGSQQSGKQAQGKPAAPPAPVAAAPKPETSRQAAPPAVTPASSATPQFMPEEKDAPMPNVQQATPASPVGTTPESQTRSIHDPGGTQQKAAEQPGASSPQPESSQRAPAILQSAPAGESATQQLAAEPPLSAPASAENPGTIGGERNTSLQQEASEQATTQIPAQSRANAGANTTAPPPDQPDARPAQQSANSFPGPSAPVVAAPAAPVIIAPTAPGIQAPAVPTVAAPVVPHVATPQAPAHTPATTEKHVEDLPSAQAPAVGSLPDISIDQPGLPIPPPAPEPSSLMERAIIHDGAAMAPIEAVPVPQPGSSAAPVAPAAVVPTAPDASVSPVTGPAGASAQQEAATENPAGTPRMEAGSPAGAQGVTPDSQSGGEARPFGASLSDVLRIPEGTETTDSGSDTDTPGMAGTMPPTPSMLKQPVETPTTLRPGTGQ